MFKKLLHFFIAIFFLLGKTWRGMGKRTRIMALLFVAIVVLVVVGICRREDKSAAKLPLYATDSQWIFHKPEKNVLKVFNKIGFSDSSQVADRLKSIIDEYKKGKQNLFAQLADLEESIADTALVISERDSLDALVAALKKDEEAIRSRILGLIRKFFFQCIVIGEDKENKKNDGKFRQQAFDRFAEEKTLGRLLGEFPDFAVYLKDITCTLDNAITQFEYLKHGLDRVVYSHALYTARPSTKHAQTSPVAGQQIGHYELIFSRQDWNDIRGNFPVEVKKRVEARINSRRIFALNSATLDSIRKMMIGLNEIGTGDTLRTLQEDILHYGNASARLNQTLQQDRTDRQLYREKIANEKFLEVVHVSLVPDSGRVATVKKDLVKRAFEKYNKIADRERGRPINVLGQAYSVTKGILDSVKIVGFFEDVNSFRTRYNLYLAFRYGVEYKVVEKKSAENQEENFISRVFHKKLFLAFILIVLAIFLILFYEKRKKDIRSPRRPYRDL
ncbi:hypothetical protein A2V82_12560 [candidate division KSB1 bacterium RBG_16_48_16]|nr:MAG: hypothetical protein A2V82_12560 [candidate division KSB1 bacterium RBG_16_48_16]